MRRMFALFGLALALLVGPARADTRVALIVANARYVGAELQNPPVDASLVEKSLRSVGFDVKVVADADLETFDAAISDFADRAKGADLALFYYAGHGFAVNAGLRPVSVLMATDAKLTATSELVLERGGIPVDLIVARLRGHAKATLVFIDACRNDPRLGRGAGGDGRGFAPGERFSGGGLYIGISTQLGDTALDGDAGRGSPFARAFAAAIPTKGLRIDDAFRVIRDAVEKETSGKQAPDVLKDELPNGSITLAALEPAASVMAPRPPDAVPDDGARARQEAFNQAIAQDTRAAWSDFLARYPTGPLANTARRQLARLSPAPVAAPPRPPFDTLAAARQDAYDTAMAAGTPAALEDFVARYPDGGLADTARRRLARLAGTWLTSAPPATTAAATPELPSLADVARQGAYDAAMATGTRGAIENFLASYPDGGLADTARRRLARIPVVAASYPAVAVAASPAQNPVAASKAATKQEAFDTAMATGTPAAIKDFLARYPTGGFADTARSRLARLARASARKS